MPTSQISKAAPFPKLESPQTLPSIPIALSAHTLRLNPIWTIVEDLLTWLLAEKCSLHDHEAEVIYLLIFIFVTVSHLCSQAGLKLVILLT